MDVSVAILAGGLGTRLRSVVSDRPKVLAPVGGRPYLTYLLDQLASAAIPEVVLLAGYGAGQIRDALGETYGPMRLVYSVEPAPLGTAGALRLALPHLPSSTVLLLNGDSYCDVDLGAFRRCHRGGASLALARVPDASRFGQVRVGRDGRVIRFEEKGAADGPGWVNAGIYLLDRSLIEEIPPRRPTSLERDLLPGWVLARCVRGFRCGGRFLDIGTPQSYAEAEDFFRPGRAPNLPQTHTMQHSWIS
ncbi:MAG TPA: nucleotidyltransferase family protein [Gemmataceae bacterium]|nr:nucleotidyltransferase family protein [Gemmataceae bacterium]